MHDLVHDLATIIMGSELLVINGTGPRTTKKAKHRYCRHSQLINYQNQYKVFKDLPSKIRSFHVRDSGKLYLPQKAFSRSRYIRVLDISGCSVEGQSTPSNILLPSSTLQLKLLRYLDATSVPITSLPESFHTLQNIETLILSNCSLETLPDSVCRLHKLCYLDLAGNPSLHKLPDEFGILNRLIFLNMARCTKLTRLPDSVILESLEHLNLSGCHQLQNLPKDLGNLQKLTYLNLSNCFKVSTLPESFCELQHLTKLDLSDCHGLKEFPKYFGKLSDLESLNLSGCHELQNVPKDLGNLQKLRYLNLSDCFKVSTLPESFCQLQHLIILYLSDCHDLKELPECFGKLSELESLNLSDCHELQNLPKDLGKLQKLTYLNLSDCFKVTTLPESFCQLQHMTKLDLSDCHDLKELPECFGKLCELESVNLTSCSSLCQLPVSLCRMIKLKYLNLSYCIGLRELPYFFGNLNLQVLDISAAALRDLPDSIIDMTSLTQFVVTSGHRRMFRKAQKIKRKLNLPGRTVHRAQNRGCSDISELAQSTCRELLIQCLEYVMRPEDAERARLHDNSCLRQLVLHWNPNNTELLDINCDVDEDKYILQKLVPPRTLEQLIIHGYMSKGFPNWVSHISSYLPSLTYISLSDLWACDNLPPFGQLPNLRSLYMRKIPNITKIGKEFYGQGRICTKLRLIQLRSMENLLEWWTTQSGEEDGDFLIPNLHNLELKDCPKLKFLPYPPRSMFWCLDNSNEVLPGEGFGKLSFSTLPCRMLIKNCTFCEDKWLGLQHLPTLEFLTLISCSDLVTLPKVIRCFTSLKKLCLMSLKDLETLPEWLGHLTSLEFLAIQNCCNITFLTEGMKNLTALKELMFLECKGLEVLPEWLGQLISLQKLYISDCPNITYLPESIRDLTALEELNISGCPSLIDKASYIPKVILEELEEESEEETKEESEEESEEKLEKLEDESEEELEEESEHEQLGQRLHPRKKRELKGIRRELEELSEMSESDTESLFYDDETW